jgi:Protein of unknown function (DUF2794)
VRSHLQGPSAILEHDPEKWIPVFGEDHAPAISQSGMAIRRKVVPLWRGAGTWRRVAALPARSSCLLIKLPLADARVRRDHCDTDLSYGRRRRMSYGDTEPSESHGGEVPGASPFAPASQVTFDRRELNRIFGLYGRKVAAGEWRDYAIDFLKDRAVFSVFRRASEVPIYRIEKSPKLARRQGAYSVISATGLIVRRGHELDRVLGAIDKSLRVVAG